MSLLVRSGSCWKRRSRLLVSQTLQETALLFKARVVAPHDDTENAALSSARILRQGPHLVSQIVVSPGEQGENAACVAGPA